MTLSDTCDMVPGIAVGMCKAANRHLVYIDNPCDIIIIISYNPLSTSTKFISPDTYFFISFLSRGLIPTM